MVRKRLAKPNKNNTIWTNKVYKITDIINGKDFSRNRYILMDSNNKVLKGYFNNTQLQAIDRVNEIPGVNKKRYIPMVEIPTKKKRKEDTSHIGKRKEHNFELIIPLKKTKE